MKTKTSRDKQTQQERRLLLCSLLFPTTRQHQLDEKEQSQEKSRENRKFPEPSSEIDDDLSLVDNNETTAFMEPKFKISQTYSKQEIEQAHKGKKTQRIGVCQPKQTQTLPIETQTDFDETFLGSEQLPEFFAISQENMQLQQHLVEQNQKLKLEEQIQLSSKQNQKKNEQISEKQHPQLHFTNSYSIFQQSPSDKLTGEQQQLPYQLTQQLIFKQKIKKDTAYRLTLRKHPNNNNSNGNISSEFIKSPPPSSQFLSQKPIYKTNNIILNTSKETQAALQIAEDMHLLSSSSSNPFVWPHSIERRRKTDNITSCRERINAKAEGSQGFSPKFILLTGNNTKETTRGTSNSEYIHHSKLLSKQKNNQQQPQLQRQQYFQQQKNMPPAADERIGKCDLSLAGQSFSKRIIYSKPLNSSLKCKQDSQQSICLSQFPTNSFGIPNLISYAHQRYQTGVSALELPSKGNSSSMDYSREIFKDHNQSNRSISIPSNQTIACKNLLLRECQFQSPTAVQGFNKKKSVSQCNFTDTSCKSTNKSNKHSSLSSQSPERLINSFISHSLSRKSTSPLKLAGQQKQQQHFIQNHSIVSNSTRRQHNNNASSITNSTHNASQRLSFSQEKITNHPSLQFDFSKQTLTERIEIKGKMNESQEDVQRRGIQLFQSIKGKTQSKSYFAQSLLKQS